MLSEKMKNKKKQRDSEENAVSELFIKPLQERLISDAEFALVL